MYHYPWLTVHVLYGLYSGRGLDYLWGMTPHGSSSQYLHTVQHSTQQGPIVSVHITYIPSQDPATLVAGVLIAFSRIGYLNRYFKVAIGSPYVSLHTASPSPGFDPSILWHSGIWGAAVETVLNNVYKKKKKSKKSPFVGYFVCSRSSNHIICCYLFASVLEFLLYVVLTFVKQEVFCKILQ